MPLLFVQSKPSPYGGGLEKFTIVCKKPPCLDHEVISYGGSNGLSISITQHVGM